MKRPLLHRLFSIWLALLVLSASVGLTVQQHTCQMSGTRTTAVIFSPAQHGCPSSAPIASVAEHSHEAQLIKSCCEFGAHFHKLDTAAADLTWVKAPVPALMPAWLASTVWPALPSAPLLQAAARWHAADTSPPPRAGRELLSFIGILVV